jgi:hypothetical protein
VLRECLADARPAQQTMMFHPNALAV